jgi:hypothetical protein
VSSASFTIRVHVSDAQTDRPALPMNDLQALFQYEFVGTQGRSVLIAMSDPDVPLDLIAAECRPRATESA